MQTKTYTFDDHPFIWLIYITYQVIRRLALFTIGFGQITWFYLEAFIYVVDITLKKGYRAQFIKPSQKAVPVFHNGDFQEFEVYEDEDDGQTV